MHETQDGVQVWAVKDTKGNDVCSVVRYLRIYPSHVTAFEQHVEFLLKEDSVYIIKFAGAYATDSAICVVLQPLAGSSMLSVVEMKQCGPLPEAFLSVVLRSTLRALQALSATGHVPDVLGASHLWLGAESIKMGTTYHFDWQPSNETRSIRLRDCISSLPEIIDKLAGIPKERMRADQTEELWAPGGFFPDAKYAVLAAAMWPLRFGKDTDDRVRAFMEACCNPDKTVEDLLKHDLIAAYSHLAPDIVYSWFKVQGEYERFKYARAFSAQRIFASTTAKEKEKKKNAEDALAEGQAADTSVDAVPCDASVPEDPTNREVGITPEGSGAFGEDRAVDGKAATLSKVLHVSPDKKQTVEEIAAKADEMSDEQLIKHLYELFQDSQKEGSNEGLFKGLRGLQSFTEADFGRVCHEFHILDRYRGAMTRTLGSPKQLRAKNAPAGGFRFKPEPVRFEFDEPPPMSDTAKLVVKLSLGHWRSNMRAMKQRASLRKYIQGTIWGRVGKLFSAVAFEEWHGAFLVQC